MQVAELASQWPLLAVVVMGIGGLFAAYELANRDRRQSDDRRITRYEDRDERILGAQSAAITGIASALATMADTARDYRVREEATLNEILRLLRDIEALLDRLVERRRDGP